jgi:PhnB protein
MAERDLIERLDQAIDDVLAGRRDGLVLADPELAPLLLLADDLLGLPDPDFQLRLKAELVPPMENEMTTMTQDEVNTDFPTVTPYMLVPDADALIAFLQEVLGAEVLGRYAAPDGRVMHAALRIGDSRLELGEGGGDYKPFAMALHVYLEDVDGVYARAVAAGATTTLAPTDQPYGDREAGVKDRWGNAWYLSTHQEEVTEEELQARFAGKGSKPRKQSGIGPRPRGYRTLTPFVHARGAREFITFLESAFGGTTIDVTAMPGREVAHATVRIGDSVIELGEAHGDVTMPAAIHLYVPDTDATYERALRAGATSIEPPADRPYGERSGFVKDAFDNQWFIATLK